MCLQRVYRFLQAMQAGESIRVPSNLNCSEIRDKELRALVFFMEVVHGYTVDVTSEEYDTIYFVFVNVKPSYPQLRLGIYYFNGGTHVTFFYRHAGSPLSSTSWSLLLFPHLPSLNVLDDRRLSVVWFNVKDTRQRKILGMLLARFVELVDRHKIYDFIGVDIVWSYPETVIEKKEDFLEYMSKVDDTSLHHTRISDIQQVHVCFRRDNITGWLGCVKSHISAYQNYQGAVSMEVDGSRSVTFNTLPSGSDNFRLSMETEFQETGKIDSTMCMIFVKHGTCYMATMSMPLTFSPDIYETLKCDRVDTYMGLAIMLKTLIFDVHRSRNTRPSWRNGDVNDVFRHIYDSV